MYIYVYIGLSQMLEFPRIASWRISFLSTSTEGNDEQPARSFRVILPTPMKIDNESRQFRWKLIFQTPIWQNLMFGRVYVNLLELITSSTLENPIAAEFWIQTSGVARLKVSQR